MYMEIKGLRQATRTRDEISEAKKALNESFLQYKKAGEIFADPKFVFEVAELVRQIAVDQFMLSDPTPLFVNRKDAALGETVEIEEVVNTMKAVRRSPGAGALAFTPSKRKYSLTTSQYDLPFFIDIEKVLRRQQEASVFADHAAQALSRLFVETTVNAISAACVGTDHYGRNLNANVATTVTDVVLDGVLRSLGDVNSDVVIAGRFYALFPITGFSGYSDVALEEIRKNGIIGTYKGARVVVLKDDYNFYYGSASIPDNKIWLAGADKGAWLLERNVSALDWQDVDAEKTQIRSGFRTDFSVTVLQPWKYRTVTIT
jgi:hypothetical protein